MSNAAQTLVHATTVALNGSGVLLLGASGSGKSTCALNLMALGCTLVADDRTWVEARADVLIATAPAAIAGRIEVRRFGILDVTHAAETRLVCAVDLAKPETERLPERRQIDLCGKALRLFHNPGKEVLPFAVLQYLKATAPKPM